MTKESNIVFGNKKLFGIKKREIIRQGIGNFHVIADFDRTLTYAHDKDGKEVPSLISVLRHKHYISPEYSVAAQALADKYRPIEDDNSIPMEEKKKAMMEWWTKHFDLLIRSGLNKKHLEQIVDSGVVRVREGVLGFLDYLHENNIPLVIMSSNGLGGDSIEMFLQRHKKLYKNIYVVSNSYKWGKNGDAIGVKQPVIHSMNKDETALPEKIHRVVKERRNVLLLGDSLGDLGMVSGFDYENLISIGFLNNRMDENIKQYKEKFDIIITKDDDFGFVNRLVEEL